MRWTHDRAAKPAYARTTDNMWFERSWGADFGFGLPPELLFSLDTVPGNTSTTATLTVGATRIVSGIDLIADQDFYKIELVAGHQYQIGMYGYTPAGVTDPIGPNGAPLLDSYLELYDAAGALITAADGGSDTTLNGANSGFDALLTFTATTSGTYYVNARAFDNVPLDGDDGDMIGDYGLYAEDVTGDESLYTPYYSPNSPLYAIDWGTQVNKVHQTYRNPDGDEGIRETGNAPSPVDPGAALGHAGKNVISIYFARAGDIFVSNDLTNPGLPPATITATGVQAFEHDAVMTALAEFAKVADVVYIEVNDRAQADFIYTSYIGTPGPGVSLLGSMSPPDESDEGLAQFNSGDERWNARDLAQGGFSFVTLIHEFGHGHGLAHPHDNGGHSGIMNGVESEGVVADYTLGDFELNQAVFTMMSYEDGWQTSPYGNAETDVGYGYLGGLMAFDIAAIQDKYGVNETTAAGNDIYVLKDVNAAGTFYSSIWDVGGIDAIVYSGARNANIDLRAASLQYEAGGGGWVSYAYGIYGGFTIANSVVIENATTGSGNDTLTGNAVNNVLDGGAGADVMAGLGGDDIYYVDSASDSVKEAVNEGQDTVYASASFALAVGAEVERLLALDAAATAALDLHGNEFANEIWGNAGINFLSGGGGGDVLLGFGGDDLLMGLAAADYIEGGAGNDALYGGDASDTVLGGSGNDYIVGGAGADGLYGGSGDDLYFFDDSGDFAIEASGEGLDKVYTLVSAGLTAGNEVEYLIALDQAGTAALVLSGNDFANQIWGNEGANQLVGADGNDVLIGYGGGDLLLGGAAGDYLDGGADSDVLEGGAGIDFLVGGGGNDTLSGGSEGDTLIGDSGDDRLDGGAGLDGLYGGAGNDAYFIDSASDFAIEATGAGNDIVYATTSFALTGGSEVETLSALHNDSTAALDLHGNELANQIWGTNGVNYLSGGGGNDALIGFGGDDLLIGGAGNDYLEGGAGADIFALVAPLGTGNIDHIADFSAADDAIAIEDSVFAGLALGPLSANAFVVGTAAADSSDRIVYDQASGTLYFDADGNGSGAAVQFATLAPGTALSAADFIVI